MNGAGGVYGYPDPDPAQYGGASPGDLPVPNLRGGYVQPANGHARPWVAPRGAVRRGEDGLGAFPAAPDHPAAAAAAADGRGKRSQVQYYSAHHHHHGRSPGSGSPDAGPAPAAAPAAEGPSHPPADDMEMPVLKARSEDLPLGAALSVPRRARQRSRTNEGLGWQRGRGVYEALPAARRTAEGPADAAQLAAMQGAWRTSDGQVAKVAHDRVVFHSAQGQHLPPDRTVAGGANGGIELMGVPLVRTGPRRLLWGDGDVWVQVAAEGGGGGAGRSASSPIPRSRYVPPTLQEAVSMDADDAVVDPSAFMSEAGYLDSIQQDAESPIVDDEPAQRRLSLRPAARRHLSGGSAAAAPRVYSLDDDAPPRAAAPKPKPKHRFGKLVASFQPADDGVAPGEALGAGPAPQAPMGDAGAPPAATGSAIKSVKKLQFAEVVDNADAGAEEGYGGYRANYVPDGEGYEALTGGRRYSTAPNLLRRVKGQQKVVTHLAKLPCCCCLPGQNPDTAAGDEYVDVDQPGDQGLGRGHHSKEYYIKKVRSILTPRNSAEEYEAHAVIVYKAFKRFPDVQNYTAAKLWGIILQAIPPENKEMRAAFDKVSKATGPLKVPVSLLHQTRLIELWWAIDEDSSGRMDFREIRRLMALLNVSIKPNELRDQMKQFDHDQNGEFDFEEFVHFYDWLQRRYELEAVHRELLLAQPAPHGLFEEKLLKFLHQTQGETHINNVHAMEIAKEWRFNRDTLGAWGLQEFSRYMTSTLNTWWDPEKLQQCQDLNQPLVHYYISSSHNTYLTGNQMWAQSSSNMYTYALIRGCRCVEVDCWDGPNGEPIVYHGYTKTTRISFESVIEAINQDAFTSTDLPVIISLEVHTSEEQQIRMVEIMKRVFGEKLHPPIIHEECTPEMYMRYTPHSLRRRILLKGPMKQAQQEEITYEEDEEAAEAATSAHARKKQKVHVKVSEALSSVIFLKNTKLQDGNPARHVPPNGKFYECTSLSETTVEKLERRAEDGDENHGKKALAMMNKFVFTRVYPKGTRIDSSNFKPSAWEYGSQMVAFNFQTPDYYMRLNQAFFKQNGGCGYVLKPKRLRDPKVEDPLQPTCPPATLKIFIISGGNLPKPNHAVKGEIIDPQVEIIVSFSKAEERLKKRLKTCYIDDNGFNPVWKEAFTIVIRDPEFAVITMRVMDYDVGKVNDFIAEASCPLSCIRKGFRSVPLYDAHHRSIPGSFLLCRFDIS